MNERTPSLPTLRGRTALVTGGAIRIGRAISLALAARGARVIIHYRSSPVPAEALERMIRAEGGAAWCVAADLARPGACEELMEEAAARAGPVDILVNNAAVFGRDTVRTLTAESLAGQFQVNLFAPLLLTAALARQDRDGQVIHLLDRRIAALDTERASYSLSKKALAEATRLAALSLAPRIRVNAVAPGPALAPAGSAPGELRERAGPIPTGREAGPGEIAEAVCFLLAQPGITGQILFVDGGQHLLGAAGPAPGFA